MSGKAVTSVTEKALKMLGSMPRVAPKTLRDNPGAKTTVLKNLHLTWISYHNLIFKGRQVGSAHNKAGKGHKELQNAAKPPLGWIFGDWYKPWHRSFKKERHYNKDVQ